MSKIDMALDILRPARQPLPISAILAQVKVKHKVRLEDLFGSGLFRESLGQVDPSVLLANPGHLADYRFLERLGSLGDVVFHHNLQ